MNSSNLFKGFLDQYSKVQAMKIIIGLISKCPPSSLSIYEARISKLLMLILPTCAPTTSTENALRKQLGNLLLIKVCEARKQPLLKLRKVIKIFNLMLDHERDQHENKQEQSGEQNNEIDPYFILSRDRKKHKVQFKLASKVVNSVFYQIINSQLSMPNQNCLHCCQFYEDCPLPIYAQTFVLIAYDNELVVIEENIKKGACSLMNLGGGFLIVNGSQQPRAKGILLTLQYFYNIQQHIKECISTIRPSKGYRVLSIELVPVRDNPFGTTDSLTQYQGLKGIIRIPIQVLETQKMFYVWRPLHGNKIKYQLYFQKQSQIQELRCCSIYGTVHKIYNERRPKSSKHCKEECLTAFSHGRELLFSQIETENGKSNQHPQFLYFKSTLLIISSEKYDWLVKQLVSVLNEKKIKHVIQKPYLKYRGKALRSIWVINHEDSFDLLNLHVKSIDKEKKTSCVIVTKFMQVQGNQIRLKELDRMLDVKFNEDYIKESRCQKVQNSYYKEKAYTFYKFSGYCSAIFSYLFLDNLSVRCEFVKQNHFLKGHKQKY